MWTLTLCKSDLGFYCMQVTSEASGDLVNLYHLSGEECSLRHEWALLADVGEQDENEPDNDDFWRAVDTGITWLYEHEGHDAAWQACEEAYDGLLSELERVEHFHECIADKGLAR